MAAPAVVRNSGPPLCPSFAEVCSFMERYGPALDLPELTFLQMERYLRDTTAVPKPLVELHVKLLRKLGRSVTTDRWEKYLAKVCQELNSTWAWELEQKGYQEMSMECKSSILKYLCECQFDENLKFKTFVNDEDPDKMRLQPVGRDRQGLMYWLQLDHEQNIRLFTEEQDDLDGSTWKCIVRTRNDLAEALELLKAQVDPNRGQDQNQAGSGSNSPAAKDTGEGESGLHSKPPQTTERSLEEEEEEASKEVMKRDDTTPVNLENTVVKEEKMELRPAAFDNRVSTITAVKQEHRDGSQNAVPIVMAPSVILTKVNMVEEAERAVVRSNQQAKIPLKKRDLKLADSFHSNHLSNSSSIIVCNPAMIHSQDGRGKAPPGSPASSQQQQLVVSVPRQELTNGRASHLPLKEGQNGVGVKGQAGAVGHVGVIRSPSEYQRAAGTRQQELNGPSSELCRTRVVEEDKEVIRKSVLVRKGLPEGEATPAASFLTSHAGMEDEKLLKPSSFISEAPESRRRLEETRNKTTTEESDERKDEELKVTELSNSVSSAKRGGGLNGELTIAGRVSVKNLGFGSEPKQNPLEEVSSELQKEGIRLKIKIPPHRRNKLRKKGGKEDEKEREPEEQEEGRSLRRSVRICRSSALPNCRPSSKVAESQRKKPQKKQVSPVRTREEEGNDEEELRRTSEPAEKLRKRRGKRRHGRPRWTVVRSKKRRPNEDEDVQDRGRTAGEEEEEGSDEEDGSDEEEGDSSELEEEDTEEGEEDSEDEEEGEMCLPGMDGKEEPGSDSGTTAVVALIRGKQLIVANAGDSRCVVSEKGKAVDMSYDHKPEDEVELARIKNAGGKVTMDGRVNGGLNLSRAIGDHFYKRNKSLPPEEQMISAMPDVKVLTLNEDHDFMVIACDGIWNVLSSQEVVDFISERIKPDQDGKVQALSSIVEELLEHCLAPDTSGDGTGCDNMTCIIVTLRPHPSQSDGTKKRKHQEEEEGDKAEETETGEKENDSKRAKSD
uniref:Remodeling and spacing factor 1 n=1 Tax=Iconisemion striatum TaxID=60296 RepID=A0A1A7XIU0_9TELE